MEYDKILNLFHFQYDFAATFRVQYNLRLANISGRRPSGNCKQIKGAVHQKKHFFPQICYGLRFSLFDFSYH